MKKAVSVVMTLLCSLMIFTFEGFHVEAATSASVAGIVATSSGNLNVRAAQSTSSSVVASLAKGSYVTLLSKSGNWWYLEYADGKYGYSHADYINTLPSSAAASVNITSGTLNVRAGAGTSYAVAGSLSKGKWIVVLSESNGWSKILYQGTKVGYVSSQYIKKQGSGSYSAISLNVPDYKQTDSRWANVTLGSSGQTIRSIGCTTTALAMTESYRLGYTIYPDTMSKKLSYSSSGSLYWPTNYLAITDGTNYLQQIYQLLKQGKPVIVGAKTASGNQHWVVVTGFTGGNSLTAANFKINDPGTSSRTNLSQFLSAYPTFYKLVYYQ